MREGVLLQALHFNSLLIDPFDDTGAKHLNVEQTDWNNNEVRGRTQASRVKPIVTFLLCKSIMVC